MGKELRIQRYFCDKKLFKFYLFTLEICTVVRTTVCMHCVKFLNNEVFDN